MSWPKLLVVLAVVSAVAVFGIVQMRPQDSGPTPPDIDVSGWNDYLEDFKEEREELREDMWGN